MEILHRPKATSEKIGVTEDTLAKWRVTRRYNLAYVKVGGRIMYPQSAIDQFLASRTVQGTEAPSADLKARPYTPKTRRLKANRSRRRRKA